MLGKGHIIVLILVFVGIFYAFTSSNIVGYVIYEPYYEKEIVEEEVPIEVEESYVEEVSFNESLCEEVIGEYDIIDWNGSYVCTREEEIDGGEVCVEKKADCFLTIKNKEEEGGEFTIGMLFVVGTMSYNGEEIIKYVEGGSVEEFRWSSINVSALKDIYCDYIIKEVPKIEECKDVESSVYTVKKKNVSVSEKIEKEIVVEKNKTIEKQRFVNKVFGYEQKFYLGY